MPHHWFNVARAQEEGRERVAAEREATNREIARLNRQLELKDREIGALGLELEKLKNRQRRLADPSAKAAKPKVRP